MNNKAANASITFEEIAMVMIKATILIQTCKVMLGQIVNITSTKWINKHMNEQINNSYRSSAWTFFYYYLEAVIVIITLIMIIIYTLLPTRYQERVLFLCGQFMTINRVYTDTQQGMCEGINSGRPCANLPRKISKQNVRKNCCLAT